MMMLVMMMILEFQQVGNLLDVCKSTGVPRSTLLHAVSYNCRPEAQAQFAESSTSLSNERTLAANDISHVT